MSMGTHGVVELIMEAINHFFYIPTLKAHKTTARRPDSKTCRFLYL